MKGKTIMLIRKSEKTKIGYFDKNTHYKIDTKTNERVLRTFIKFCKTNNTKQFVEDIKALKFIYGKDYLL